MKQKFKELNFMDGTLIGTVFLYMIVKTYIFTGILTSHNGEYLSKFTIKPELVPAYIAMILIITIPVLFFKSKGRVLYLVVVNLIYTLLMYCDLLAYRATSCYLGLKYVFNPDLFDPSNNMTIQFSKIDLIVLLDLIIVVLIYFVGKKIIRASKRGLVFPIVVIVLGVGVVYSVNYNNDFLKYNWVDYESMKYMWPLGYHYYEAKDAIEKQLRKLDDTEVAKVDEWLEWNNENLPDNEFKGIFEGKNVIYIQAESLENFVIGKTINGQEITPVLNSLINKGIYFPNIYEQNSGGNSVDADLLVNTSVFTLEDSIAFLTDPEPVYLSMARILKQEGYSSNTLHVIKSADYKWAENHKHSLGFDDVWDINDFNMTFKVGNYYSDQELFEQQAEKVKDINQPFFSMIPTATSHGPFYITDEFKMLNLTEEQNANRLGEYFQMMKYLDTQIGHYLNIMEEQGQLENSVFVIYGDHGGVHKYYSDMIVDAPFEGNWWQEDSMTLPLIIYSPNGPVEVNETYGGLVDVMPTVLYTLGIEVDNLMGRNLLNTERNATVYTNRQKQRTIAGIVKDEEEERRLIEAYDVSRIIIKDKYYSYKTLRDIVRQ